MCVLRDVHVVRYTYECTRFVAMTAVRAYAVAANSVQLSTPQKYVWGATGLAARLMRQS